VVGELSATFTFSAARAARAAAESGETLPPPPPGLDGNAVRLDAGPGAAQVWTSSSGAPALIVARAAAPTAFSSGVPFEQVRDYLLSLPGLPDDVAAQLRTYTADGSVLPLPVPADQVTTSSTEVDGNPATVLAGAGPAARGRRLGGRWDHDRRGRFAGRRRGPVDRPRPEVSVAEPTTAPGATEDASGALGDVARLVAELPPPAAVWCSGLRKRYGRQTAVSDVSLEVGRGEVVGLLGPNGAGKTSVIKMLLGLVRPDGGEVLLLGQSAADPAARARVGYLPELFRYQPWLSPIEVLTLHVRLSGIDVPVQERRDVLELVGLAERADDRLGGFSKGMQQRLGLAVALVARPELVVLDEPTSALDPLGRVDVRDVVLALKARGVAVLLNSHLIGEVERVCDRVVILDRGRVAASGTLAELLGQRELRLQLSRPCPRRRTGA
jgi:ABC-2 type transport system ATP-binding protein